MPHPRPHTLLVFPVLVVCSQSLFQPRRQTQNFEETAIRLLFPVKLFRLNQSFPCYRKKNGIISYHDCLRLSFLYLLEWSVSDIRSLCVTSDVWFLRIWRFSFSLLIIFDVMHPSLLGLNNTNWLRKWEWLILCIKPTYRLQLILGMIRKNSASSILWSNIFA